MIGARLASERGTGMLELVLATGLMAVVLGAVFGALSGFETTARKNEDQNDSQERARKGVDQLARDLRNLASPTPRQPDALERAEPYDIVFQTVDPDGPNSGANSANVRRVRYCLESTDPSDANIWLQTQTWTTLDPPPVPAATGCPSTDWGPKELVAYGVTNRANGADRPVWGFGHSASGEISSIRTDLFVDANKNTEPGETRLQTSVFLRNLNLKPSAAFTATVAGSRHVLLNGWASQDPEGQVLQYTWYAGGVQIGTGIQLDWQAPSTGSFTLQVKVVDPAGLDDTSAGQLVTVT